MSRGTILLAVLWALAVLHARAQRETYTWDDFISEYTADEEQAEDEQWTLWLEELKDIHEQPMNINTASVDDLQRLPFLNTAQIEQIHAYIYLHGAMQTLGELRLIPLLDQATRQRLSLFVYAAPPASANRKAGDLFSRLHSTFSARTDVPLYYRKGFQVENGYAGDPLYHRMRYDVKNIRHLQAGMRVEKDAGERYYDTYGAYAMLHDVGILRRAIVGDYRIGFGEGVVVGGSIWNSKSTPSMKELSGMRPMTGMDESRFMRGAAATLGLGREVELSLFASHRKTDATLNADGNVQTLLTSGYHRSDSERRTRRNVSIAQGGAHLVWHHGGLHIGATGYVQHFSRRLDPGQQPYRRIYPRGTDFGVAGMHYSYSFYRLTLAGETALSLPHAATATLNRASWNVNSRYTLSLLGRYYAQRYHSFLATAFAENSSVQNESGLLVHLKAQPWEGWQMTAYLDFFHNPWPRYRMTHSSSGQELMTQAAYTPDGGRNTFALRYQLKRKEQADRLRIALMAAYFHATDYSARLYAYEPALQSSVTSAILYGHGLHAAFTARLTSRGGRWMGEAKYSLYRYFDRDQQASGLQTIMSPWKNDLSFQVRFRF